MLRDVEKFVVEINAVFFYSKFSFQIVLPSTDHLKSHSFCFDK